MCVFALATRVELTQSCGFGVIVFSLICQENRDLSHTHSLILEDVEIERAIAHNLELDRMCDSIEWFCAVPASVMTRWPCAMAIERARRGESDHLRADSTQLDREKDQNGFVVVELFEFVVVFGHCQYSISASSTFAPLLSKLADGSTLRGPTRKLLCRRKQVASVARSEWPAAIELM